jgi:Family of unknown function (DUF5996)
MDLFYAYTYPEPHGLSTVTIRPVTAFYSQQMGEFLQHYDDLRNALLPEQALLEFFQSTYEAGATLGRWDREQPGPAYHPWWQCLSLGFGPHVPPRHRRSAPHFGLCAGRTTGC